MKIYLNKINPEIYSTFIKQHFEKNKFKIQTKYINTILILTDNHTYYTQRMCHEIFQLNEKEITPFTILKALRIILNDNEGSYFQYRKLITGIQWHLLGAIAMEEKIEHPYNQDFIYLNIAKKKVYKQNSSKFTQFKLLFCFLS